MREDNRRRIAEERGFEGFPGMDETGVEGAHAHLVQSDQAMASIEHEGIDALAIGIAHEALHERECIGGMTDSPQRRLTHPVFDEGETIVWDLHWAHTFLRGRQVIGTQCPTPAVGSRAG